MGNTQGPCVQFDKVAVFSPGDVIKGKVTVPVGEEGLQKIKGIWVDFSGQAKVKFTTTNYGRADDDHTQEETYFTRSRVVFGTGKGQPDKPDLSLPAGTHTYPFSFRLPTDRTLPASFSGEHGQVWYQAQATLSIIRKVLNKNIQGKKVVFTVRGPKVDLNDFPAVKAPVKCDTEVRNLFGIGLKKGTTVSFRLPKRGFVPGDKISVTGRIDNKDGDEQRNLEATLVEETTYTVEEFISNETETKKRVLSRASTSAACPKGKVTNFTMVPLKIPSGLPSSEMPGCKMIDVEYYVKCNSRDCIETSFRITMGTIPLRVAKVPTAEVAGPLPIKTKTSVQMPSVAKVLTAEVAGPLPIKTKTSVKTPSVGVKG